MGAREEYIAGLRQLADALEGDSELPLPNAEMTLCVLDDDDVAGVAQVEACAARLGVETTWHDQHSRCEAKAKFGPITYGAFYCSVDAMRRYHASISYSANVAAVA